MSKRNAYRVKTYVSFDSAVSRVTAMAIGSSPNYSPKTEEEVMQRLGHCTATRIVDEGTEESSISRAELHALQRLTKLLEKPSLV